MMITDITDNMMFTTILEVMVTRGLADIILHFTFFILTLS